jgi:plastocyanin
MKKILILSLIFTAFYFSNSSALTWTVNVGQGGSFFVPDNLPNVHVGDTVKWVWIGGSHTTTSTSVPAGASTWDAPINSINTTFIYKVVVPGTYNYVCTIHAPGMSGSFAVSISDVEKTGETVNGYGLAQNYPNPFNPSTVIKFSIPQNNFVTLKVYDISGKELQTLVNSKLSSGEYKYTLDGSALSSGIYIYKLSAGDFIETKRMTLIK